MRLFAPHILCAAIITGISILLAYLMQSYEHVIGSSYMPWLWKCLILIWTLAMSCISWITVVRLVEYKNLSNLIAPSATTRVRQRNFIETLNFILFRECNTIEFFTVQLQKVKGCRGRQRVAIAVIAQVLDCHWNDAKHVFKCNHVTKRFGSSWKDYFIPEWTE